MTDAPLLAVEGLSVAMGGVPVLEDVSFSIAPGETLGLVGESGCGKSVTALSIMRLLPDPPGRITAGRILFDGVDMTSLDIKALRAIRGDRIGMIFQEPMTSLNPVFTIGDQIGESLIVHRGLSGAAARAETARLLDLVGHLGDHAEVVCDQDDRRPGLRLDRPHQVEDLRLDGDVERGGRLVGDQQAW